MIDDADARQDEFRAAAFRPDPELEHLAAHPELLDRLPPSNRIRLGLYKLARDAAQRVARGGHR